MEQNTISLLEIIQLMKEVKDNTDNFITNLNPHCEIHNADFSL